MAVGDIGAGPLRRLNSQFVIHGFAGFCSDGFHWLDFYFVILFTGLIFAFYDMLYIVLYIVYFVYNGCFDYFMLMFIDIFHDYSLSILVVRVQ